MPAGDSGLRLEVRRLQEEQRAAEQTARALSGEPILNAVRQATLMVQADAKRFAGEKVDTGAYRASITPEVRVFGNVVQGVVGSNLEYGPFVELDTRPHWPPIAPILEWVHRKRMAVGTGASYSVESRKRMTGVSARLEAEYAIALRVQAKIARSGTKGVHALTRAVDKNVDRIVQLIDRAAQRAIGG